MKYSKNIKGTSLVEMVVGLGLFTVIMSITVGFFAILYKLQIDYRESANVHQEGRIMTEIFSRFAREAEAISPPGGVDCETVEFTLPDQKVGFSCVVENGVTYIAMDTAPLDGTLVYEYFITSGNVTVTEFKFDRGSEDTYPGALNYSLKIQKTNNPKPEDEMDFSGFIVTRSEL